MSNGGMDDRETSDGEMSDGGMSDGGMRRIFIKQIEF